MSLRLIAADGTTTPAERTRRGQCPDNDCDGTLHALLPLAAVFPDGMAIVDETEPGSFAMTVECDGCGEFIDIEGEAWDLRFAEGGVA